MRAEYVILIVSWAGWCVLHSALAGTAWAQPLEERCGRYYRMVYNAISVLTLCPVWIFTRSVRAEYIWVWSGWMQLGQVALLFASVVLFVLAARRYDMKIFLGLVPMERGISSEGLDTGGVLALVRHPWYLAGLLLIWSRDLTLADLWVNLVICAYLWIGSILEERKLVQVYGEVYRDYQRRVPMLVPWKWSWG